MGILTHRDVLRAPGMVFGFVVDTPAVLKAPNVADVMTSDVITTTPDATVQEAVQVLLKHRVGCLPVVEDETLVGVVTTSDLLRHRRHPPSDSGAPGARRQRAAGSHDVPRATATDTRDP